MPAEFEPHEATWVAWPHNAETWPGCMDAAEQEFAVLVGALAESEPVRVLVRDAAHAEHVRSRLGALPDARGVNLVELATNDAWLRDTGPTFVEDPETALLAIDWTFNSWGEKYPPWDLDDAVATRLAGLAGVAVLRPGLVVEGGALEVDGEGTLLVTRSSLLGPSRNPGLRQVDLEERLSTLLGTPRVIWLDVRLEGDDTDGHIDNIARFVAPGRLVCSRESDREAPDHAVIEECRQQLCETRDAVGRTLEVIDLPMADPLEVEGERLPASHSNFYIANRRVLVPVFGGPTDAVALEILAKLFPGRKVVGIPCRNLIRGLGAVHCLTQQQPRRPRRPSQS